MLPFLQCCLRHWTHYLVSWRFRRQQVFAIAGVRRSGNHACVRWLINALEGEKSTLIKLGHGVHASTSGQTLFFNEMNYRGLPGYYARMKKHALAIKKAKCIVITTEDYIPERRDPYVPAHAKRIAIHRHLLNTISSRLKKAQVRALDGFERGDMKIDHEFMNCVRWLHEAPEKGWIRWSYDDWVSSNDYRNTFLSILSLQHNIEPGISMEGDGSSFSGQAHVPEAHETMHRYLQVTIPDRVKTLLLESYYRTLLEPEFVDFLVEDPTDRESQAQEGQ